MMRKLRTTTPGLIKLSMVPLVISIRTAERNPRVYYAQPQDSHSHQRGRTRTPQQNGRGTETTQRGAGSVNAGSKSISRDRENQKTLKEQHTGRKQKIRSESACGNGGERGPLSGGDDYSPNSHKTPKKIRDRGTETPHVDGKQQYPKNSKN